MNEHKAGEWSALTFALIYPTLLTLVYFVWLGGSEHAQQVAYSVGKVIQFAFPVVWVGLICRKPIGWPRFNSRGVVAGIAFGLVIAGGICGLYFAWFRAAGTFAAAGKTMLEYLSWLGVANPAVYAAVALFYSLLHSLMEEYYWRWFAFGRMRQLIPLWPAVVFSSLCFMAHHIVVLGLYFGWTNSWTWLFSFATAVGGGFWAWLYQRSGSIYGPWFSHLLIDAAIFGVGYDLVRAAAAS
jgi:uncharacterized protein